LKQHVISEWLLRDFSSGVGSARRLATYSKVTHTFAPDRPEDFMARLDSHPIDVEHRLQRIESPAARAARGLVAKALTLPAGITRITDRDEPSDMSTREAGEAAGFHIVVAERGAALLGKRERTALAKFMTLMFTRSPKTERTIRRIADLYEQSARLAMARAGLPPGLREESEAAVKAAGDEGALRAIDHVRSIGTFIADMHWWIVRAAPDERFVLGDTPLAVSVALGYVDEFRPLVGRDSFVLTMPLHPEVALVATPKPILPVSGDSGELVAAINRASWGWAEEQVVAAEVEHLELVRDQLPPTMWARVLPVPFDEAAVHLEAAMDVAKVLVGAGWRPVNWDRCYEARLKSMRSLIQAEPAPPQSNVEA